MLAAAQAAPSTPPAAVWTQGLPVHRHLLDNRVAFIHLNSLEADSRVTAALRWQVDTQKQAHTEPLSCTHNTYLLCPLAPSVALTAGSETHAAQKDHGSELAAFVAAAVTAAAAVVAAVFAAVLVAAVAAELMQACLRQQHSRPAPHAVQPAG